jgi:hypothetical protein
VNIENALDQITVSLKINHGTGETFQSITKFPSFFHPLNREEVTEIMKDKPDGSFLVRDAARSPGSYTLTLRCAFK